MRRQVGNSQRHKLFSLDTPEYNGCDADDISVIRIFLESVARVSCVAKTKVWVPNDLGLHPQFMLKFVTSGSIGIFIMLKTC